MAEVSNTGVNTGAKKHYAWLDIAKALGVLATIVTHCFQSSVTSTLLTTVFFLLFFTAAGYTIKPVESARKLGKATWNDFTKMIVPSFFVFLLSGVYSWWTSSLRGEVPMWAHFVEKAKIFVGPDVPIMWFFIALFWAKLVYRILLTWFPRFRTIPILFLLALCLRFSPEHRLPLMLDVVPMLLIFMDEGQWIKWLDIFCEKNNGESWFIKYKWPVLVVSDLICAFIVYRWVFVRKYFTMLSARDYTVKTVIMDLAFLWLIVQGIKLVQNLKIMGPLRLLGKHTLGFIYIHFLDAYWLVQLIAILMAKMGTESPYVLFVIRFTVICILLAICVYIQKFGKEKIALLRAKSKTK